DFHWEQDKSLPQKDPGKTILQPEKNLLCGVKIMKYQIVNRHKPLLWEDSYWVTLRPGTMSYEVFAKQMTNVPAVCRQTTPPMQEAKSRRPGNAATTATVLPASAN